MGGESTGFRRHAFLQATVAGEANYVLVENPVFVGVKTRGRHFCGRRDSNSIADALAKRASCGLYARCFTKFRMSGRFTVQLPEAFDLLHRQVVSAHVQPGIEKHTAVTG